MWPFGWFRQLPSDPSPTEELVDAICFSLTNQNSQWKPNTCVHMPNWWSLNHANWWSLNHANGVSLYISSVKEGYMIRKESESYTQVELKSTKLDAAVLKWQSSNLMDTLFPSSDDRAAWLLASQAAKVTKTETE
jgi:hypothetical protein